MAWEHFHLSLKTQVTYMCVRVCVYIYIHNWGKEKKLVGHSPFSKSYKWVRAEDSKCSSHNFFNAATIQNTAAYRLPGRQCPPARSSEPSQGQSCGPQSPCDTGGSSVSSLPYAVCLKDEGKPRQWRRTVDLMTNDSLKAIYILNRVNPSSLTNPWRERTL